MDGVKLTKNKKSIEFIFEAIRREDDWENKLVDKMRLYKEFYENFMAGDSGYLTMPQLILVAEDELHMKQIFKVITMNETLSSDKFNILYTTDLRQNKETLEKTLVEFKLVDGKYKMEDIEIKLLGL